jgi:hypothetical protein
MLNVVKTTKEHLEKIKLQPEQVDEFVNIDIEGMHSIVDDNDNVFMIFKAVIFWQGRGQFKSFISADAGKHLLVIVRYLKILYQEYAPERLEVEVLDTFANGKRLVELLGFKREAVMRKYYNGNDYCLYVKFKGE